MIIIHKLPKATIFRSAFIYFSVFFCFLNPISLSGLDHTDSLLPLIKVLDGKDPQFMQFQKDVEDHRKQIAKLMNMPVSQQEQILEALASSLTIYRYIPGKDEDIFTIAAQCTLPYESIATLNRIHHPSLLNKNKEILLPSIPGLYIPEKAMTDIEQLMETAHLSDEGFSIMFRYQKTLLRFTLIPGVGFNPTERAFFLNTAFRYPLPVITITSRFGIRSNPITRTMSYHQGLDLAAPTGTEVYATYEGTVIATGYNAMYGNYVIIQHPGGWTSLYGHLSTILTDLRKSVHSGTLIGMVGSTGQSTGPHLHFELRQNGKAHDPESLLPSRGIK
jgi:hypothetical protein